jgi:hypothetical protein
MVTFECFNFQIQFVLIEGGIKRYLITAVGEEIFPVTISPGSKVILNDRMKSWAKKKDPDELTNRDHTNSRLLENVSLYLGAYLLFLHSVCKSLNLFLNQKPIANSIRSNFKYTKYFIFCEIQEDIFCIHHISFLKHFVVCNNPPDVFHRYHKSNRSQNGELPWYLC